MIGSKEQSLSLKLQSVLIVAELDELEIETMIIRNATVSQEFENKTPKTFFSF